METPHNRVPPDFADSNRGEPRRCGLTELAPPDSADPVLEVYKKNVDRTLLIENLSLSHTERAQKLVDFVHFLEEIRKSGRRLRGEENG